MCVYFNPIGIYEIDPGTLSRNQDSVIKATGNP
jgi:hypothetical protein